MDKILKSVGHFRDTFKKLGHTGVHNKLVDRLGIRSVIPKQELDVLAVGRGDGAKLVKEGHDSFTFRVEST